MKRNLFYLAIILLFGAAIILINRSKQEARKVTADMDFVVADVKNVERIVISYKNDTADLTRETDHWKINGKYRVMQPKMDVLLETIGKLTVYSPVSNMRREAVMKDFESGATKVQMYRAGEDDPFKVYYVDGATEDSKGTYMLMEIDGNRAQKPYVMSLPGFEGILNVRFFTDETDWRDTKVFDNSMEDIKQITVKYPADPDNSFYINVLGTDSFMVYQADNTNSPKAADNFYKEGVVKYLSSFKFLNAEVFANDYSRKDSVLNSIPYAIITITEKTTYSKQMVVYHMPLSKRSKTQFDQSGNQLPHDLDRYYASINGGKDFVVIQDFVFGKIFRKYSDFLLKE